MSEVKVPKLGTLKLTDAEKEAIAELVESDGFKVWKRKVMPNREVVIAGTALSAVDEKGLWYAKGMSFENSKQIGELEKIAAEYNKNQDPEG
jgi:hypothetical protein